MKRRNASNIAVDIRKFAEYRSAADALAAGAVAAVAGDSYILADVAEEEDGLSLVALPIGPVPYAIGLARGSSLREAVDFTLQDMKADGSYDRLHGLWFPETAPYPIEVSSGNWSYPLASPPEKPAGEGGSAVQQMMERGKVIAGVGVDNPPFSTYTGDGQIAGLDPAIVHEFARRWLGDADAVEFVTGSLEEQVDLLVAGEIDLIAAAIANERVWADQIDFSQTYVGPPAIPNPVKIGVRQHDTELRKLVNLTLQDMQVDGVYEQLFVYWLGAGLPLYRLEVLPTNDGNLTVAANRPSTTTQTPGLTPEQTIETANSTLGRIRARSNTLIAGVKYDFAPFGSVDESGEVVGFDVDLLKALAANWGIEVEFVPVTSANRIEKLASGEVDIVAASMTHTQGREVDIDFSQTYFVNGQSLLVRRESGIGDIADLDNRVVAAIEGSTSIIQINDHAAANGVTIDIAPFEQYPTAVEALIAGEVDAVTTDSVALRRFARDNPALDVVGGLFTYEPYAIGIKAGDSTFTNLVNYSLQDLKESGVYDELYLKWFGSDAQPYALEVLPGVWPYTFFDAPASLITPDESRVERILLNSALSAGVALDLKPFSYQDESGQYAGFDIDILHEFAKRWLGDKDAINFVPISGADSIGVSSVNQVDLIVSLFPNDRWDSETLDRSQTYYSGTLSLLAPRDDEVPDLADLADGKVGLIRNAPAADEATASILVNGIQMEVVLFAGSSAALDALDAGQIEALAVDSAVAAQLVDENIDLRIAYEDLSSESYAIGLPKYDHRFRDLVNFTLQEMKADGTYDRLAKKWLGSADPFPLEVWPGESYLPVNLTPMLRVPEGVFVRGNDKGLPDEQPEHSVTIDEFYIDQYEVTNRHYDLCVRAGSCRLPQLSRSLANGLYYADPVFHNFPVIWITWDDAADYCAYVGKRLPTEAEWEKAVRGTESLHYPWSNEPPVDQANFGYATGDLAQIGEYPQDVSPFDVHDMAGNVREWVADWYRWDYYVGAPDANPTGPSEGTSRIVRGGSWDDDALSLRSSMRRNLLPAGADANLGFRCASSTPPSR